MLFTLFTLLKVNADFQMDPSQNYEEKDLPGQANPAICGAQITQRYGCSKTFSSDHQHNRHSFTAIATPMASFA
jgi:hypothetical protein